MLIKQQSAYPHQVFSQRLLALIESAGYPCEPEDVRAALLNVNPHLRITLPAVRHWLTGFSMPRSHNIKALADWLNVPPCMLACGENYSALQVAKVGRLEVTIEVSRVMEIYLGLRPNYRRNVEEVIKALTVMQQTELATTA